MDLLLSISKQLGDLFNLGDRIICEMSLLKSVLFKSPKLTSKSLDIFFEFRLGRLFLFVILNLGFYNIYY